VLFLPQRAQRLRVLCEIFAPFAVKTVKLFNNNPFEGIADKKITLFAIGYFVFFDRNITCRRENSVKAA
jgi:hypothetical protein